MFGKAVRIQGYIRCWRRPQSCSPAQNPLRWKIMSSPPKTKLSRYGGWLPSRIIYGEFVKHHVDLAVGRHENYKANNPHVPLNAPLPPGAKAPHVDAVQAFADAINGDLVLRGLFDKIFLQASPLNQVQNFDTLLFLLDIIVAQAPSYFIAKYPDGTEIGEPVGVPIYLILDLLSNTSAGYDLFRLDKFNAALKDLLNSWGAYLANPNPPLPLPPSNSTLNDGPTGWFSEAALKALGTHLGGLSFEQTYVCPDPDAINRGFTTWDDFFVRQVQERARPVYYEDDNSYILNACESTTYKIAKDVKLHDQFWLKDQPYSLYDMLNGKQDYAKEFVGGTVYQAFLSPFDYHRWHSPVNGTIKDIFPVPGTYYAALPDEGAGPDDPPLKEGDPHGAIIRSQGWLTVAATRAVILIEAEPPVGLLCFIGVGMVEVSTCDVVDEQGNKLKKGDTVKKGQQIGTFRVGGSSYALILRPGLDVLWTNDYLEVGGKLQHIEVKDGEHIWVRLPLGKVFPTNN